MAALTLVGTGLDPEAHVTRETRALLGSGLPLYCPPDEAPWPGARAEPPAGEGVVVYHGHPAAFRRSSHELMAGHPGSRMVPAVWAEDCLCADLELDPLDGWQAYDAANFLLHGRAWSPRRALLLWRVGSLWERDQVHVPVRRRCLGILVEHLGLHYPPDHTVVLYDGNWHSLPLSDLPGADLMPAAALYVPALGAAGVREREEPLLSIIGTGMEPGHVTPQAERLACQAVFYLGEHDWLPSHARPLDLAELDGLLGAGTPCTLVVPGHATMGGYGREVAALARGRGYGTRFLPSVSPLGALYAQLGFNPVDGLQVFRGALPEDYDDTSPAILVTEEAWVQPISPRRVASAVPGMLDRLTVAAARENVELLLEHLSSSDRERWGALLFDRQRQLADELGLPSVKRLKPQAADAILLKAAIDFSTDRILEVCQEQGLDATSSGSLLVYAAQYPDSPLARLAWLNAYAHKAQG